MIPWTILHAGHVPLGPVFRVDHGLLRTTFPYAAHSYIINHNKRKQLLQKVSKKQWQRPLMVEGWTKIGIADKFACFPSLTTQSEVPILPKLVVPLVLTTSHYSLALEILNYIWLYFIPLLLIVFVLAIVSRYLF